MALSSELVCSEVPSKEWNDGNGWLGGESRGDDGDRYCEMLTGKIGTCQDLVSAAGDGAGDIVGELAANNGEEGSGEDESWW